MGDVTRLLFLLNKKPGNIEMPPDGLQLLEWSEQTLKHYLDSQVRMAGLPCPVSCCCVITYEIVIIYIVYFGILLCIT